MKHFLAVILSILSLLIALFFGVAFIASATTDGGIDPTYGICAAVFFLIAIILFVGFKKRKKHIQEIGKEAFKAEIEAAHRNKRERKGIKREQRKQARIAKREAEIADRIIDYVVIAGSESKTNTGSAIARGVVGEAMLGRVGILAAAGAKKDSIIGLVVRYKSGRTETVKVKFDSKEFKRYAKYIKQ